MHFSLLLESPINSNFANQIALSRLRLLQCTLIVTALALRYWSDCHVHPTCYCYWLANSFSQFLPPGCECIRGCSEFVLLYCIIVLHCMIASTPPAYNEYWYFHSPPPPLCSWFSFCVINLYWIIVLTCIIVLNCIIVLCICIFPFSLQWVPASNFDKIPILLYVTVYEYFHLREISKQLGCYSPKMQKKFWESAISSSYWGFKIWQNPQLRQVSAPCRYRTEPYYCMLRCMNIFI